jgi:hypothetical protein
VLDQASKMGVEQLLSHVLPKTDGLIVMCVDALSAWSIYWSDHQASGILFF